MVQSNYESNLWKKKANGCSKSNDRESWNITTPKQKSFPANKKPKPKMPQTPETLNISKKNREASASCPPWSQRWSPSARRSRSTLFPPSTASSLIPSLWTKKRTAFWGDGLGAWRGFDERRWLVGVFGWFCSECLFVVCSLYYVWVVFWCFWWSESHPLHSQPFTSEFESSRRWNECSGFKMAWCLRRRFR